MRMLKQLKSFTIILLLSVSVYSQTAPKALLGPRNPNAGIKQTRLGFRYDAGGFDEKVKEKKIQKAIKYLQRRNAPQYIIDEFVAFARKIGENDWFPNAIDNSWENNIKPLWLSCGENSIEAKIAREFKPSSILITVKDSSFYVQYWRLYANGMVPDNNNIWAVVVAIHSLSKPENASLVRFDALMDWELGNLLAWRSGYKTDPKLTGNQKLIDLEIGNSKPCGKIPRK